MLRPSTSTAWLRRLNAVRDGGPTPISSRDPPTATRGPPLDAARRIPPHSGLALAAISIAVGAGLSLLVVRSAVVAHPVINGVLRALFVASWGAAGLITWRQRPESRLGPMLVGVSWIYAVTSLIGFRDPSLYTVGRVAWAFVSVAIACAFLSFPGGRLRGRVSVVVVSALALSTLVLWTPLVLGASQLPIGAILTRCAHACPQNPFRAFSLDGGLERALSDAATIVAVAAYFAAVAVALASLRQLGPLHRRAVAPPLAALTFGAFFIAWNVLLRLNGSDNGAVEALGWLGVLGLLAFPFAMLFAQARGRLFAAGAIRTATARVARHEPHADLRSTLAEALDDPTVEVGFARAGGAGYVDAAGAPLDLASMPARSLTSIVQDGRLVAVIAHDVLLDDVPGLVQAAGESGLLMLENARLERELEGTVGELRASRARIVSATEAERRRLEQDLHDSAQQRLVALRVRLGLAEERAAGLSDDMRAVLAELGEEADEAIESVRSVAQGIYPPMLAGGGLPRALAAEARRMPVQIHVAASDDIGRAPPETEAAVYFCCIEALQNAVKHGGPMVPITIELHRQNGDLAFSVRDDGAGFDAAATSGTGLMHMRDRIGGVGGALKIASNPGEGTTVAGTVPWARIQSAAEPPRSASA